MKRPLPSLNALRAFEVVGRTLSFTKAASALGLTQSALSRQVKALETALDQKLIDRNQKRIELTPAGQKLLAATSQAFDTLEKAIGRMHDAQPQQALHIRCPPFFASQWLIPRLREIEYLTGISKIIISSPDRQNDRDAQPVDCEVRWGDGSWQGFNGELLRSVRLRAFCAPQVAELYAHSGDASRLRLLIFQQPNLHIWQHCWDRWLEANPLPGVNERLVCDSPESTLAAACKGLGVALADPVIVESELSQGQLVAFNDHEVGCAHSYWIRIPGSGSSHASKLLHQYLTLHFGNIGQHNGESGRPDAGAPPHAAASAPLLQDTFPSNGERQSDGASPTPFTRPRPLGR